jgi:hypothetical protein
LIDRSESDRVVVVGSGFGVWKNNAHVASARWTDVARIDSVAGEGISIKLLDGTEISINKALPGYSSFFDAAGAALSGMRRAATIESADENAVARNEILFERRGPGKR